MRFIRKGGRIIPIRSEEEKKDLSSAKKLSVAGGAVAGYSIMKAKKLSHLFSGIGVSVLAGVVAGKKAGFYKEKDVEKRRAISRELSGSHYAGLGIGLLAPIAETVTKVSLVRNKSTLKKGVNKFGDAIMSARDKVVGMRKVPKNVDLSKGAKTFKGKYNQLSGLLGR